MARLNITLQTGSLDRQVCTVRLQTALYLREGYLPTPVKAPLFGLPTGHECPK